MMPRELVPGNRKKGGQEKIGGWVLVISSSLALKQLSGLDLLQVMMLACKSDRRAREYMQPWNRASRRLPRPTSVMPNVLQMLAVSLLSFPYMFDLCFLFS
ncbi:unnamed protein product [Discosporangium mesarthrocarpum]